MQDERNPAPTMGDGADAIDKLKRYAFSRDRRIDREPRTITITDDEAVALLAMTGVFEP